MIPNVSVAGRPMPALGLGTWKAAPGEVGRAVREALAQGYRHLDCAAIYGNEAEVGQALSEAMRGGLAREELWVTSKLWNDAHAADDVEPALRRTLEHLGLGHLDLYLIHWPVVLRDGALVALDEVPIVETWRALETMVERGLCRAIGVSNFSAAKLGALLEVARVRPACLQVEMHPYLAQPALLASCREQGIAVTAYSPLGSPDRPASMRAADDPVLLEDPVLVEIARRHGASPAQVALAWALARGTAPIPKTVRPERLRENLAACDLSLGAQELRRIDALDRGRRYVDGSFWVEPGGPYTLASLWDE